MQDLYLLRFVAERSLNEYARSNLGCEATLLVDEFAEKLLEELDYVQVRLLLTACAAPPKLPTVYNNQKVVLAPSDSHRMC